jgi:PAS domain S-box-containing protein
MVLMLIILTIAAISWIYYLRQRDIYRELFFNENKLRESQEEFKTILYSIGDGVITTDKNGLIRQMNPVAEKLTGWNENEATGLPLDKVFRIIHEISRKVVENPVELVLKKGMIVSPVNHTLLISKSGNEIPIADSGAPILKEGKEVSGVVLIFRDQTKERMAHEALTERDRRYESFINSSRDMIFIKDDRFRYIVVNDQIARFLNRSKEDMLLKTDFELMDEKEAAECKLTDEKTIHSLSPVITEEIFGDKIYETNKFRLILSGNRIGIGGIMRDITASKNMMSELIEAKNKAEENNRLKTAFLNNLSHEIRTPLNGIVGFTELINDPSTNILDRVRFGKIVKKNSDWLLAIITDIISIATIETGQEKLNESPTDINKLFYDLYHRFILVLNDKPIELSFRNGLSQEESEVIADEGKLKQVIANLLSNAIKFTEKGAIKVQCNLDDRQLKFSVEDTGIGIPENLQQVIFEKFRKGETDNDKIYQGNGLGLAISKAYVELMGGTIIVKSRPGEGSCFTFTILHRTVELEQSNRIKHKMINENAPSATTKTILVVEDEESNYLLIEKMLFPSAFRTIHVTNGQDAVMECMGHPEIELILMDLKLPGMSGYEATRRIKEKFPHLPIVAVTAYALAGDREKALNAGCDDYLPKPFDRRDLMEMINKHWRVES